MFMRKQVRYEVDTYSFTSITGDPVGLGHQWGHDANDDDDHDIWKSLHALHEYTLQGCIMLQHQTPHKSLKPQLSNG
ncbi:hypothetical protein PAAG_07225 [Paracoccidioides lutzii Pb01]|uniref:Uncharacterized protein n=1 Tax=Paracoccidioides lutzii (strain ATCC MYA-826 / Pb01) TaxID=502779 RepID=C1H8Y4_PARBA|nr:hypothetical protein PAAG_07225 [Paracoccidioides lutzii Pb01]EEH36807.2 hypothetical protein PAAG_07225 [Paracoccidioides lutzii Pb01]